MPVRAARICACGHRIASGALCACQVKRKAAADARRPSARERGYDSKWDRERAAYLALHPRCARPGCDEPATVVDHIVPHRGDHKLFWSRSNWQPLCRSCHARWKQAAEARPAQAGGGPQLPAMATGPAGVHERVRAAK